MWSHKVYKSHSFLQNHVERLHALLGGNVLMYGPRGGGKYRILDAMLHRAGILTNTTRVWTFRTYTFNEKRSEISLLVRESPLHSEFMLRDIGSNERHIVKHIVSDLSKNMTITANGQLTYKLIVIHNVDYLSIKSHDVLATCMERHVHASRFIFITSKLNMVSPRLQSRCMLFRISRPPHECLQSYMLHILECEHTSTDPSRVDGIIRECEHHIDNSINVLQLSCLKATDSTSALYDAMVEAFFKKANIKKLRDLLYVLIVNNKEATDIFHNLITRMYARWKDDPHKAHALYHFAAEYEWRSCISERYIYHIEAFLIAIRAYI